MLFMEMVENEFWNNLDNFVERKKSVENVGNWLSSIPDISKTDGLPKTLQNTSQGFVDNGLLVRPISAKPGKNKKKKLFKKHKNIKNKELITKKIFETKKNFIRRSKLRRKRRSYRNREPKYFGPQVECNFTLPRVSAQLERLMNTNVVRLIDRKFMLELQRRIQQDYNETLKKRIASREHKEVERERLLGSTGMNDNFPKLLMNQKANSLLTNKRDKLRTVREKNAERLIKQGKRWERERILLEEQERIQDIIAKKNREQMLEEHTLYIFDSEAASETDIARSKNRKKPDTEIDLKNFLLSERNDIKKRINQKDSSFEGIQAVDSVRKKKKDDKRTKKLTSKEDTPEKKSVELMSDFNTEKENNTSISFLQIENEDLEQVETVIEISPAPIKKKISKDDEDPKLFKFKLAESVQEIYDIAEEIISGEDGESGKKKMW